MAQQHPWSRYVALGDSFTEGIGDSEPRSPGGNRSWADRVAEVLSAKTDDFAYANLAIRGRLLQQILDEQVEPALALRPDLVTISAGGNDIIRPGTDPDEVAGRLEGGIARLRSEGATVVLFNGPDIGETPVLRRIRGKVAIYNENLHYIAKKHGNNRAFAALDKCRKLTSRPFRPNARARGEEDEGVCRKQCELKFTLDVSSLGSLARGRFARVE